MRKLIQHQRQQISYEHCSPYEELNTPEDYFKLFSSVYWSSSFPLPPFSPFFMSRIENNFWHMKSLYPIRQSFLIEGEKSAFIQIVKSTPLLVNCRLDLPLLCGWPIHVLKGVLRWVLFTIHYVFQERSGFYIKISHVVNTFDQF